MTRRLAKIVLGAGVFTCMLCIEDVGLNASRMFARADAVIGRPLTPMSYAGVARRTSRRAAYRNYNYNNYNNYNYGGSYGYNYNYNCQPLYDQYGRLVRSC